MNCWYLFTVHTSHAFIVARDFTLRDSIFLTKSRISLVDLSGDPPLHANLELLGKKKATRRNLTARLRRAVDWLQAGCGGLMVPGWRARAPGSVAAFYDFQYEKKEKSLHFLSFFLSGCVLRPLYCIHLGCLLYTSDAADE